MKSIPHAYNILETTKNVSLSANRSFVFGWCLFHTSPWIRVSIFIMTFVRKLLVFVCLVFVAVPSKFFFQIQYYISIQKNIKHIYMYNIWYLMFLKRRSKGKLPLKEHPLQKKWYNEKDVIFGHWRKRHVSLKMKRCIHLTKRRAGCIL